MSRSHAVAVATVCAGIFLVKVPTAAADDLTGPPSGPYIGAAYGRFDLSIDNLNDAGTAVSDISHSTSNDAFKIVAGWRLLPYLSIEGDYMNFGTPHDSFDAEGSGGNYRVHLSGFAPFVVGTLPLGPVELFAKGGYLYYDTNLKVNFSGGDAPNIQSQHDRGDFIYGGGVGVTFFNHLNLNVEYDQIRLVNAQDSNALWLGAAWRFLAGAGGLRS